MEECPACSHKERKWYHEKLFQVILFLVLVQIIHLVLDHYGITVLHSLLASFYEYVGMVWFPILIGLLLGGVIEYYVPRKYIIKFLAQHKKRTIIYSVGLGFLMSACSHGILAISMELYKKGASTPAVIAFLLASPWANLPVTILLFGLFGAKAILFILSAIIIAITTGFIYQFLDKKGIIECNKKEQVEQFSVAEDIRKRIKSYNPTKKSLTKDLKGVMEGAWQLTKIILWWILIGMFLASVARAYVPKEFFTSYMSPTIAGLIVTLLLATVIEICSEGSAPLAFEIYRQTRAFGNTFTFLMAGVATDYTEIGLIWANIGKKAALLLPIITVPQIIILGYLFNILL